MNVIGLISGTSVDGIDAALVSIAGSTADLQIDLLAADTYPYPETLRSQILSVCGGASLSMEEFASLDDAIAYHFAQSALTLQSKFPTVDLIGSHGQTVYHRPPHSSTPHSPLGYSLQLGRGSLIAHLTGIPTISNFRAADVAAGGQGAPLVSPIDVCLLSHPTYHRCVQNLGGIGNLTYLPPTGQPGYHQNQPSPPNPSPDHSSLLSPLSSLQGWDTGPGNALLDLAVHRLSQGQQTFDQDGVWAAQGTPCTELVQQWLQQDYFQQPPPKSTGRELFGPDYLDRCLQDAAAYGLNDADVLSTLTELTAASIAHGYRSFLPRMPDQVLLCGGGSRNPYLRHRIQVNLPAVTVHTTDEMGLSADFKEAISFAVLAYWRYCKIPGNLPEVTGARRAVLLGEIHLVA